MERSKDLVNFIIDIEDESCPNFDLHLSAYQGEAEYLDEALSKLETKDDMNNRIRPFLSSPLRLAATAGKLDALRVLLRHGASVDLVDVKSQTPLFVALVNRHWDCAEELLSHGAEPDGDPRNLCTPLCVMAQRGFYEGVRLLLRYGALTEDPHRLLAGRPSLPLTISATYHHLNIFAILLIYGAEANLDTTVFPCLPEAADVDADGNVLQFRRIIDHCSVPHTLIRHRCPPEFLYLYYEFGGNLWIRDGQGRLATEIMDEPLVSLQLMKRLQETPLSLQSLCRLSIRRVLKYDRLDKVDQLPLNSKLADFVQFREIANSTEQFPPIKDGRKIVRNLNSALKEVTRHPPERSVKYVEKNFHFSDWFGPKPSNSSRNSSPLPNTNNHIPDAHPPPPPPPPPPPIPPRPMFLRFPEVELPSDKSLSRH